VFFKIKPNNWPLSLKEIWTITWPQILTMFFHFLIGFTDVFVAGRLGKNVQDCMRVISEAMFFFLVVAMAVGNGSVAAISQSLGSKLPLRAQRYMGLSLQLGFIFGLIILVGGLLGLDIFLKLLQIPEEIYPIARYLLKISLYLLPAYYLLVITNAFFRAQKKVLYPLYSTALVAGINILGDFGLGLGLWGLPKLDYKGLAWATFGSIFLGFVVNLIFLLSQNIFSLKNLPPWRWIKKGLPYLFKVAWPAGTLQIVWHSAYMVLYAIVASLPVNSVEALAGMSAGIRIESFLFLPGFAFNFTASILVGHLLGAGDLPGAKKAGYQIMGLGLLIVGLLAGLVLFFIEPVAGFIAPEPLVRQEAINYLYFNVAAIPFLLPAMILGGALTGAGATLYQMIVMGSSAWLVRIPLAYILGHVVFKEATGIWLAMFISMVFQALLMLFFYHFKNWSKFALRNKKIAPSPNYS